MQLEWTDEELIEHWTLDPSDYRLLANKSGSTRLALRRPAQIFSTGSKAPGASSELARLVHC